MHAPGTAAVLDAAARHLRPGSVLLIVDDMLARPETARAPAERSRLANFKKGWRLGHVPDEAGLVPEAETAGFEYAGAQGFTPLIRLNRLRLDQVPLFANVIGGNAVTESYRHGTIRQVMVSLRRRRG